MTERARHGQPGRPYGRPIGHGVTVRFTGIYGRPRREHGGVIVAHVHDDGTVCEGGVTFDTPVTRAKFPDAPKWTVVDGTARGLTLTPSIAAKCGLHGYITAGRWVPC